jgi:hypothetical protein|tara:strand:- start:253 stop:408 length:156 start_codon:yes stop_codon:yes gene_type:complete
MILQFPANKSQEPIECLTGRVSTQKTEIQIQAKQISALVKRLELKLKAEQK